MPEPKTTHDNEQLTLNHSTVIDLNDLTTHPEHYSFFSFRPNLRKLILAGAADAEHISILWYTASNSSVGLHYHALTESVYTIDGFQRDVKGCYPTGSLCFNPPGSGHEIFDSTGFFLLAYAAPPDFTNTDLIRDYAPVRLDVASPDLETAYPFSVVQDRVQVHNLPLPAVGGIRSQLIRSKSSIPYVYRGNYLLVLSGSCRINGMRFEQGMLIVATNGDAQSYAITADDGRSCLVLGLSFTAKREPQAIAV